MAAVPPTAATIDSEIARLSTGHLALILMISAPSTTAASIPAAMVEMRGQQPVFYAADDDRNEPAVGRHARDSDAVVHAAADGAGHFRPMRVAAAAGAHSARSACRPVSAAVPALQMRRTTLMARSSWAASIPESSTATMRGSERAAMLESQPIFW